MTAPSIDALLARDEVLLLAHAGGNFDAPQETLYAYRCAIEAGSDALDIPARIHDGDAAGSASASWPRR